VAAEAVASFGGVKRRLELLGTVDGVEVYDDFAHHPTAIAATLEALRAHDSDRRLIALVEPRSNTMRLGEHRARLAEATAAADEVYWYQPQDMDWSLETIVQSSPVPAHLFEQLDDLASKVVANARAGDLIVIMSNGSFGGVHAKVLNRLAARQGND